MPLLALGLNYKTAPLAIREQIIFAPEHIDSALHELVHVADVDEAAIISTCNRTEVYCKLAQGYSEHTLQWFLGHHQMHALDHDNFLYRYSDSHTIKHLLRVASGLDSMVLGEPQILGQLKEAYRQADQAGTLGPQLGKLFQHAFSAAKHVRSKTSIGNNPVSVAFAAVRLAQQIFTDLSQQTALMIGAGETIELATKHLHNNKIGKLIIANRSLERAETLAKQFNAEAIQLSDLANYLPQGDIVLSSTASQLPIIGKGAVESALKQRKHKPMFMVDIAVPRDIETEVADLQDVYLYNIDDLEAVTEENRQSRVEAAKEAEVIIDLKAGEFIAWQKSRDAIDIIRRFRENAHLESQTILEKAQKMLAQGKSADEALEYLAHALTNKLLHTTTSNIDTAAREGREDLLQAACNLFNLEKK